MTGIHIDVPSYVIVYEKKRLKKVLRQAGQEVAAAARKLVRGTTSPSKPGQPPGSRTGTLASSIAVRPSKEGLSVSIRDSAFYSLFLESGAKGGGGRKGNRNKRGKPSTTRVLQPRPFLSTALEERKESLSARIRESILNDIAFRKMK